MKINNLNRKMIAQCFGVAPKTISRWFAAGMPRNDDGKTYSLPACIKWRMDKLKEDIAPGPDVADESKMWLARYREQRARLAEIERKSKEGEYLPADEVQHAIITMITAAKSRLLSIQSEAMPFLLEFLPDKDSAETVRQLIDDRIRNALTELSEMKFKERL